MTKGRVASALARVVFRNRFVAKWAGVAIVTEKRVENLQDLFQSKIALCITPLALDLRVTQALGRYNWCLCTQEWYVVPLGVVERWGYSLGTVGA